ncbi:MAG TPA: ligase-associated DNA damage response endonuclease PdeM [Gemmatimonadaceae bacterium]|nr:ligase-associated DNA damage response endonuclease PdeM [Gemmatimonadaceae bacterium]
MTAPARTREAHADIVGERLVLLPERAAFWERTATLLVADTHFGKAATFRAAGIPVPRGTTTASLDRLDAALARTNARRIVFLGDFLHAREGREAETTRVVGDWRSRNAAIEMLLVRGNHDVRAGDPGPEIDLACVDGPVVEPPFVFTHKPMVSDAGYVLCGHVHPGARLTGPGRERAWLPCFWFAERIAILPAFGEFTGLGDIDVVPGDRVWVVADAAVLPIRG